MINKRQLWWDDNWTVLSFPKRNKTILWNADLKEYDLYDGVPKEDKIQLRGLKETKEIREKDVTHLRVICWIMSGALGVTLALLLLLMLLK